MEEEESSFSLDTVLVILRRFWFLIILAAIAGGSLAFYLAGRQNYVYQKTASVMMRDANPAQTLPPNASCRNSA